MSMRKLYFVYFLALASLMLVACSVNAPKGSVANPTSPKWGEHEARVKQLKHYQVRGSFAYLSDKRKVYAHFFWRQYTPNSYLLLLISLLGDTEIELKTKDGVSQLTDNEGKRYISDSPDKMIQRLTGMSIPIANLKLWILGLPGKDNTFTLNSQHRLAQVKFTQHGKPGSVIYQSYDGDIKPSLPHRLKITQGKQHIKLKMDSWMLN